MAKINEEAQKYIDNLTEQIEDLKKELDEAREEIEELESSHDYEDENESLRKEVENLKEELEENESPESVIEWFASPFISDYDKQTVLNEITKLKI